MKKILCTIVIALLTLALGVGLIACKDNDLKTFTVSFDTGVGGSSVADQQVQNGKKVQKPNNPTNANGDIFVQWNKGTTAWRFDVDIVTEDMTLTAAWRAFSSEPVEAAMKSGVAFSNTVVWYQGEIEGTVSKLHIKPVGAADSAYTELAGTRTIVEGEGGMDEISFVPTTAPQGGAYHIKIETIVEGVSKFVTFDDIEYMFKGAGTNSNPYLVVDAIDINTVITQTAYSALSFKQMADIEHVPVVSPVVVNNESKLTFAGTYDGNGYKVVFTGDGGLFHKIASGATVKNLTVGGDVTAVAECAYAVGGLTDENSGTIDAVYSTVSVSNDNGTLTTTLVIPEQGTTVGGAAGVAGTNKQGGVIRNSRHSGAGTSKGKIGSGAFAAYNFGTIEGCSSTATLPAGNQANSGQTSSRYAFGGGIAGFNYGTIRQSIVSGRVFAQSAYSTRGDGNEGMQAGFGGIVAYNGTGGVVTECAFARSSSAKEFIPKALATSINDVANNLGVASIHGDIYVGGIAGINEGTISYSYVNCAIIAGRDFVGGITGKMENGTVTNSYVVAEIKISDDSGLPVTTANAKTTLSKYELVPAGKTAAHSVYLALQKQGGGNWVSGTTTFPEVPTLSAPQITTINTGTANFKDNGKLKWETGVTSVALDLEEVEVFILQGFTLVATVTPQSAQDHAIIWSVNDDSLLEILGDGTFKAKDKAGVAIVTATTRDGGHTATCEVTIRNDYKMISQFDVSCEDITLPEKYSNTRAQVSFGTEFTIKVVVGPEDALFTGLTFRASNSRATVDENGKVVVTGTSTGSFSIYVGSEDPQARFDATTGELVPLEEQENYDPADLKTEIEYKFTATNP